MNRTNYDEKTMKNTERFNMVLPRWLKDQAKLLADAKGISLAELMKDALKEAVKNQ